MNTEQAKQTLLCIKSENLCIDDIRIKERYYALNMAIKSLEIWDKIIENINTKYGHILKATKYGNEDAEQQSFSYKNVLMYEVSDILDDILYDIEECRKEVEE